MMFVEIMLKHVLTTPGLAAHQTSFLLFAGICVCSVNHLADLLGNICSLERVQKVMICDWWILIRFVCFFVAYYSLGQSSTSLL